MDRLVPTMTASNGYLLQLNNPDEYWKAVAAAGGPTDTAKTVIEAQRALERGDIAMASALLGKVRKDNYIAPVDVRQGNVVLDPDTNKPMLYNPQVPHGAIPTWGNNGMPKSVDMVPGAVNAITASEGASAGGRAAFEPIAGVDADGDPIFTNKRDAASGGTSGSSTGSGTLDHLFGRGGNNGGMVRPALSAAETTAQTTRGQDSAARFNAITQAGAGSQERQAQLHTMLTLAQSNRFGPGSEDFAKISGYINTAFGRNVIDPKQANAVAVLTKNATQLAANQASALGLNGTDAKFGAILAAVPNPKLQNGALREMANYFLTNESAIQAKANAATAWNSSGHGASNSDQFERQWRQAYNRADPVIAQVPLWVAQGPAAFQRAVKALPPAQRARAVSAYQQLKQLGAF